MATQRLRIAACLSSLVLIAGCNSAGTGGTSTDDLVKNLEPGQQVQVAERDPTKNLRAFCPRTIIRAGTETYRTYENGVSKDDPGALNSLKYQATVREVARECNYTGDQLNIRVGIRGRVINGPTGATGTIDTPIRVAVVSTAKDVLYSQLHQVPVSIPEGGSTATFSFVDGNIFIPAPEKENLVIYVGFDEGPPEGAATQ
ncbi:MAG: hypothetical protein QNJ29_07795 [Rhizobiaceae bacterium]|nr:hypothetical protein [Rhizobiaceae bacterium]